MKNNTLQLLISLFLTLFFQQGLYAQQYEIDTLQYQGTDKRIVNLVIMGDGYTVNQLADYTEDARRFTNYFFQTEPFRQYANYFNVFAIKTISEESGATHACTASDCPRADHGHEHLPPRFNEFPKRIAVPIAKPNTIFGSSFDNGGLHRLVVPQHNERIEEVLKNHIPNHTQVVILVNSPFYGGSGGKYATTTVNFMSNDIAVHEIGHSFAILADEYWAGNQYAIEGPNRSQQADPELVPWKHWLGTHDVGVYAYGGSGSKSTWFRPHEFCKMQYLVAPFCSVCQEAFVETIHHQTHPILSRRPLAEQPIAGDSLQVFALKLLKPSPNTLAIQWYLNADLIATGVDSLYLNAGMLSAGANQLKAVVRDTTALVRIASHKAHVFETTWTISNLKDQALTAPESTWGDRLETCFNGYQVLSILRPQAGISYNWYENESDRKPFKTATSFVTPKLQQDKTYYVESAWKGKVSKRVPIHVVMLPEIQAPREVQQMKAKQKNSLKLVILDQLEEGTAYLWSDADGKPLYEWDEFNGEYVRPNGVNSSLTIKKPIKSTVFYVQKINKTTTCMSEKLAIVVQ